jgi:oligopeptide/dipeptide ABC transporter ATP-binding protein
MYLGREMEEAAAADLVHRPRHPYTRALIAAAPIPDPVVERARRGRVLEGELPSPMAPPSGCVFRTRCPFATDLCAEKVPKLEMLDNGHQVACHHHRELPEGLFPEDATEGEASETAGSDESS